MNLKKKVIKIFFKSALVCGVFCFSVSEDTAASIVSFHRSDSPFPSSNSPQLAKFDIASNNDLASTIYAFCVQGPTAVSWKLNNLWQLKQNSQKLPIFIFLENVPIQIHSDTQNIIT